MNLKQVCDVLVGLQGKYGTSIATSEAFTEQKLFSLKYHNEKKLHKHLDDLADLKNRLAEMGINFSPCTYQNAIITSIPKSFTPIVTALNSSIAAANPHPVSWLLPVSPSCFQIDLFCHLLPWATIGNHQVYVELILIKNRYVIIGLNLSKCP